MRQLVFAQYVSLHKLLIEGPRLRKGYEWTPRRGNLRHGPTPTWTHYDIGRKQQRPRVLRCAVNRRGFGPGLTNRVLAAPCDVPFVIWSCRYCSGHVISPNIMAASADHKQDLRLSAGIRRSITRKSIEPRKATDMLSLCQELTILNTFCMAGPRRQDAGCDVVSKRVRRVVPPTTHRHGNSWNGT
jgi:hypothetical protein